MAALFYFLLAVAATTLGALTGMGGGVILKPVMDMMGQFDAGSIAILSSITVFVMSLVTLLRGRKSTDMPAAKLAAPLALGAVVGGSLGSMLFDYAIGGSGLGNGQILVLQNSILAGLILAALVYMQKKQSLPRLGLAGILSSLLAGAFLGTVSAFLGIGGGPVNITLIIFLFSMTTKTAALCSLITILFSQAAKLLGTAAGGGFAGIDLAILPAMAAGGVLGGLIGGTIHGRIGHKTADVLFTGAQVLVLGFCVINILRNL